ncbi:MAG: AsmA-like C-terminal region-containing protein [Magnetococcus sp. DMHC-8]
MTARKPPPSTERRALRTISLAAALLVLFFLSAALLLHWLTDVEHFRPKVVAALEQITGRPVSLESILFAPTEGVFALELKNLQIHGQTPTEPPLLTARKVQVGIGFFPFLYNNFENAPLEISSLTLNNPQINIVQRDDMWLVHLLQDAVEQSDRHMRRHLGWGLTQLSIHSIKIRNGMLTLLNWEHATGQAVVFDRIQADLHALTAQHPSPVSLAARFQAVPFTVTGQIGPLPASLDLADMPMLLNLEAKTASLMQFADFFTHLSAFFINRIQTVHWPREWEMRGARGYFATLINGTLKKGLQTKTRLELDKLILAPRPGPTGPVGTPAPPKPANPTEPLFGKEAVPVDLAVRQKSILRLEQDHPLWLLEEGFLYLDGKPILDIKGSLHDMGRESETDALVNLTITTLASFDSSRFAHPLAPFWSGGTPQGTVRVQGAWPHALQWSGHLDLTQTALSFPPAAPPPPTDPSPAPPPRRVRPEQERFQPVHALLHALGVDKQAGIPLVIDWHLLQEQTTGQEPVWLLKELLISRPALPPADQTPYRLRLSGSLQPTLQLALAGEWELSILKEYLTRATAWNVAGVAHLEATMTLDAVHDGGTTDHLILRTMDGQLRADSGHLAGVDWQDFSTRIELDQARLVLSELEANTGLGRLNGQLLVDFAGPDRPPATYHALFAFAGVVLGKLAESSHSGHVGLSPTRQAGKQRIPGPSSRPAPPAATPYPPVEGVAFGQGEIRGQLDDNWLAGEPFSGTFHLEIEPGYLRGVNGALFLHPPAQPQLLFGTANADQPVTTQPDDKANRTGGLTSTGFYWDRLTTGLRWHNSRLHFDNLRIDSGGLQITGRGTRAPSGQHGFDLLIRSPLQATPDRFNARLEGDAQHTLYRPEKSIP